ncbi:MAG: hypothetical protein QM747_20540 [Nocardioides sp.]
MTSNLGCVGLAVADVDELAELLDAVVPTGTAYRQADGSVLYVWTDASGARLTVTTDRRGEIDTVVPSYAAEPGATLAGLAALHERIVIADVVEDGEVATRLVAEVLPPEPVPGSGATTLTALGVDVSLHASVEEYEASDAALLTAPDEDREEEENEAREPLRMGSESFISYGAFSPSDTARPLARLAGRVLGVQTATVEITGQAFHAVRVRTVGMELDVCLAADDHADPPVEGGVVAGTVWLVADVVRPTKRRRWWGR